MDVTYFDFKKELKGKEIIEKLERAASHAGLETDKSYITDSSCFNHYYPERKCVKLEFLKKSFFPGVYTGQFYTNINEEVTYKKVKLTAYPLKSDKTTDILSKKLKEKLEDILNSE
ncbi:MAG: hypothetical protein BJBARM5_1049 [Candidatus Parvarchaeum acidophilus ARMAN-5]|jgi:hypothetical protein|uniref:Uncharacterized protein n=1 Tax=Candidatus Parvarchaeum acidophilus ARMAN-5 TaxID=662762 RepID=D6GX25_PARA5|nr:MAG: hypothetical protein BJBARM5_1049 [Candidatus Parvarchaeum acidophilus ARMAN-5]